jgi:hypothetical protein
MPSNVVATSLCCALMLCACPGPTGGPDAGSAVDAGHDVGTPPVDAGTDAGLPDAGPQPGDAGTDGGLPDIDGGSPEAIQCANTGGAVVEQLCCAATGDFPDLCSVGACGCSPSSSHTIHACSCPDAGCYAPGVGCH